MGRNWSLVKAIRMVTKSPETVRQEVYGYLCTHYAIRALMAETAHHNGIDPDRVSFTGALRASRRSVRQGLGNAAQVLTAGLRLAVVEISDGLLAERRLRSAPRVVKRTQTIGTGLNRLGHQLTPSRFSVLNLWVLGLDRCAARPSPPDLPRLAAEIMAVQLDKLAAAAEGCDALVASGLLPAAASARSVTEKLGIRHVYAAYCPIFLAIAAPPSDAVSRSAVPTGRDRQPGAVGPASPACERAVRRGAQHPQGVDRPVTGGQFLPLFTDHPWLAADPTLALSQEPTDLDVMQTGAWILPDERALPAELVAFLNAGHHGVRGLLAAPTDIARVAIEAIRAQDRRAVAGTTTTAARAGRLRS